MEDLRAGSLSRGGERAKQDIGPRGWAASLSVSKMEESLRVKDLDGSTNGEDLAPKTRSPQPPLSWSLQMPSGDLGRSPVRHYPGEGHPRPPPQLLLTPLQWEGLSRPPPKPRSSQAAPERAGTSRASLCARKDPSPILPTCNRVSLFPHQDSREPEDHCAPRHRSATGRPL